MEFKNKLEVRAEKARWVKIYRKNIIILTEPLHFNPEPIDENYHSLLNLYKKADIFDLDGLGINAVLDKLIQVYDRKIKEGIHTGYLMPIILYIIDTLQEIEDKFEDVVGVDTIQNDKIS